MSATARGSMFVIVRFQFRLMLMRMRHAKSMQFVVAVVTSIMAVPVGMAMFVNVSVTMRVRMYDITMSVLVGVFVRVLVRMQMLVRVRVSFLMVVIVLFARHVFTSALSFVIEGYESLGEQSSGPGLACAASGNHRQVDNTWHLIAPVRLTPSSASSIRTKQSTRNSRPLVHDLTPVFPWHRPAFAANKRQPFNRHRRRALAWAKGVRGAARDTTVYGRSVRGL